jgi:hypothetical protein
VTAPSVHPDITQAEFFDRGYEVVVRHAGTGQVRHLGGTAAAIWALIDGATPVEQIIDELGDLYGVPPTSIESDIRRAVDELAEAGLLATPGRPAAATQSDHPTPIPMPRPPDP